MDAKFSADLTRTGPGTVMGDFMRQYWIPALKSDELKADGDPMRLMLLGEKLVAFRDSGGRVGVMDQRCPHRCASLFLARNEQNGLRCIYHGWKFDIDGRCVDMPNVPADKDFKQRVKARAYKTHEANGLVWVYMGVQDNIPALPVIDAAYLDDLELVFVQRDCNWMQALEGDIDTSHLGFLHLGSLDPEDIPKGHHLEYTITPRTPEFEVSETPCGTMYGAFKQVDENNMYWRCAHFMFPFWTQTPAGAFRDNIQARAWVPIDDEHTMTIWLRKRELRGSSRALKGGKTLPGSRPRPEFLPNDTGWLGRWRLLAQEKNDWLIDREAQRNNVIYSGIDNIGLQDQAVTESMGSITDHAWEHLGAGDKMVACTRLRAVEAARQFRESGVAPPGIDNPGLFLEARGGFFTAPLTLKWPEVYRLQMESVQRPEGLSTTLTR